MGICNKVPITGMTLIFGPKVILVTSSEMERKIQEISTLRTKKDNRVTLNSNLQIGQIKGGNGAFQFTGFRFGNAVEILIYPSGSTFHGLVGLFICFFEILHYHFPNAP